MKIGPLLNDLWYVCIGAAAGAYFGWSALVGFPTALVVARCVMWAFANYRITRRQHGL